jgi:hypothetical protein
MGVEEVAGTMSSDGVPRSTAFSAMRARRPSWRSKAMARALRAARIHSMATEPEPAPTSHRSAFG